MTPLGILRKLIQGLTQNTSPAEIAAGAAFGALLGFVPKTTLTAQLLLVLLMLFRTNVPVALASAALFSLLSFASDPLAHLIGYKLLAQTPSLTGLWTYLYNLPVVPWTAFNNTLVLGNFVLGLALFVPVFFAARRLAAYYQANLSEKVRQSRFVGALRKSWIVDWYFKVGS